ncbi:MAG: glycosyltransferase [Gemmatimonadota bacterium]|jgi:glycosyltransferase involved in cell wall biosynthesis
MRVLHLDTATHWGAGQDQVRLLMREIREQKLEQMCLTPAGSQLEARLRTEFLPVQGVEDSRGPGFRFTRVTMRLAKNADLVHAHDTGALGAGRTAARWRGLPFVAACREVAPDRALQWGRADRVIAVSAAVRDALVAGGLDEARIRLIHSGIDAGEIERLPNMIPSLRDRIGVPLGQFLVGAVGSLHGFRNQRLVPQAAARARDVAWVVIGDGPDQRAIEAAVAAHGVEANVRLVGGIMDPRTALRELDILVSPAAGEALGTRVLEAMAIGLPVLATDDAGPAEILGPVHTETGIGLFPPGDPDALAEAVNRLRNEPQLRARVAASQKKRVSAFSIDATGKATVTLYREMTANRR